jgi:hypothetical protein
MASGVTTGRQAIRYVCPSCEMRYKVGEPKAQDTWPAHLTMSPTQVDLLLVAAAEYRDLCEEAGEYQDVIGFVDWVRPDALRPNFASPIVADGPRGPQKKTA